MPRLTAPKTCRGARGSKRGPAPSACSLGDVAARRRSAGYRTARSRAAVPRAADAWCPCPGTRHDVPPALCDRGDAGLASPRRRSRLTPARGVGRADATIHAPTYSSDHAEYIVPLIYKQSKTTELLKEDPASQRWHREPRWKPVLDVQVCPFFDVLLINPSFFLHIPPVATWEWLLLSACQFRRIAAGQRFSFCLVLRSSLSYPSIPRTSCLSRRRSCRSLLP